MSMKRNMKLLYQHDDDPHIAIDTQQAIDRIQAFVKKWKSDSSYTTDPAVLRTALDEYENLEADYYAGTKEACYRWMKDTVE